jgi:hypothetical protein
MNNSYSRQWLLPFSQRPTTDALFSDLETILRLGPQWDVKAITVDGLGSSGTFHFDVEYDRTETQVSFSGKIIALAPGQTLRLAIRAPGLGIDFAMDIQEQDRGSLISFQIGSDPAPEYPDIREYDLWARSIVNYLKISESSSPWSKIWKWFLDRHWLKMTQSGKRIVFFVVVSEGFSLVFLIAILLWWKLLS